MIINVSSRTDIPSFYWDWFSNRLNERFVMVRNPNYPEKVSRYSLDPSDVDGLYLVSKNYTHLLHPVGEEWSVQKLLDNYACHFVYTITPYRQDIEPLVPPPEDSLALLRELSLIAGREKITFQYNPVFIWGGYDLDYHMKSYETMAAFAGDYAAHATYGFITMYDKVIRNCPGLRELTGKERHAFLYHMGWTARKYGMTPQVCEGNDRMWAYGFETKPCMSHAQIAEENGRRVISKAKAASACSLCGACQHRDIGIYNSCYNGCRYCYANTDPKIAYQKKAYYDPHAPMLLDSLQGNEEISEAKVTLLTA